MFIFRHNKIDGIIVKDSVTLKEASNMFGTDIGTLRRSLKNYTGQYPGTTDNVSLTDAVVAAIGTQKGVKSVRRMFLEGSLNVTRDN